jgi:probable HAF family extracellular repeat protein
MRCQYRPYFDVLESRITPSGGKPKPTLPPEYNLTELGTLGGLVSEALDVNDNGLVVGYSRTTSGSQAFLVEPEDTDNNSLPDRWFRDTDGDGINDLMTSLTTVPGLGNSQALGINASGQIVGWHRLPGAPAPNAFLITPQWIDGKLQWSADANGDGVNDLMTNLGTLGGSGSIAFDINDLGQIVGYAGSADGNDYPFLWNPDSVNASWGTMIHLGTLGGVGHYAGDSISAYQINNAGQIVGVSRMSEGWLRGFVITPQDTDNDGTPDCWADLDGSGVNTLMSPLGGLAVNNNSKAYAINETGMMVGEAGSTISTIWGHAVRWDKQSDDNFAVADLGGLHAKYYSRAQDVNTDGVIVGYSQEMTVTLIQGKNKLYEPVGEQRAFVVKDGKLQALDQLVSGLAGLTTVNSAAAISDNGYIVGWGEIAGNRRAFIAVPITSSLQAEVVGPGFTGALTTTQVQPLLAAAIEHWQAAGADISGMSNIDLRVVDLGGTTLGLAAGNTIWLDDNAAGLGWFVDSTPWNDSTTGDQGEEGRTDLPSVLMHEVGHLLGFEHEEDGIMQESLALGTRWTLSAGSAADWIAANDDSFGKTWSKKRK